MTDGLRLRESWTSSLNEAQAQLRSFLASSSSSIWRRVPPPAKDPATSPPSPKGKGRASLLPDEADVNIHKRSSKSGDIFRLVLDIPADDDISSMESWKTVLATPETRKEWDPAVENAHHIETFDSNTRVTKTYYTLGWPANPRDSITISRTYTDPATLIDVSTSLPRSPDEPGYLRSTPPYVRSHVHLVAWCIQVLSGPAPDAKKVRITCFWQHDLKAVWGMGTASRPQHLTALLIGLVRVVRKRGNRVPLLHGFGLGVSIDNLTFDTNREALTAEYSIHHDSEDDDLQRKARKSIDELHAMKERRRLERAIECTLPSSVGWDVQLTTRGSSSEVALPWTVEVVRKTSEADREYLLLWARHAALPSKHAILKVTLSIEVAGGTKGLRLNGSPHPIEQTESRDPSSFRVPQPLLQDATSVTGLSFHTASTAENGQSDTASSRMSLRLTGLRTQNGDKSILALVRRNYVYFASLLQEPEAKWKPLAEARGVTVNQLDSIDPTLVVYRAEAVFVGVGLWDLLSVVSTPGAAIYWDKTFDDATLLEDVNELTDLWHLKTKAAWPVQARESVLLRISYKSPNSVHLFSFSTDDANLFPQIPPSDPNFIRTQVDLRGWAIEALSPNTTQITLIEQSDPKGWSNKSSIPQQMIATLAGVGEFCIKAGGPPIVSRLGGGRAHVKRYDHEKGVFRLEYEGDISRRANSPNSINATPSSSQTDLSDTTVQIPATSIAPSRPFIECELRCDLDTWATSLEVLIDPPAQSVSCLRRHRLAEGGGGLWLTIEHDADFVVDEQLKVMVRRGTGAKGTVLVNGAKVKVEVQELPEADVKSLVKRKRVRPTRIPLDQPPVLSVIKRRKAEWADEADEAGGVSEFGSLKDPAILVSSSAPSSARGFGTSPFTKFLTTAISQATSSTSAAANAAVAAVGKPAFVQLTEQSVPSPSKAPIQHALDALAYLRMYYNRPSQDGWTLVNETGGFAVHKKLETEVSTSIPVHRGEKVIEGFAAEDVASVLAGYECRRVWDDKFDSAVILEDYGAGCHSAFTILKGGFPFRDRGFYTASVIARVADDMESKRDSRVTGGGSTVIYCATTSYHPDSVSGFSAAKYNPHSLPIGRVHLQGWILETLDPYTAENYTIPSTRCTHLVAVDFAGAVPVAFNAMLNAALPRAILGLENYIKANALVPSLRVPTPVIAVEREEGPQEGWTYERRDLERLLVGTRYAVQSQRFRATVLVETPSLEGPSPEDRTPTPSQLLPGSLIRPSGSPERSATLDPSNSGQRYTPSTVRPTGIEGGTTSRLTHTQGGRTISLRAPLRANSTSPRGPTTSLSGNEYQLERDFLIAEIIVSLELYPSGFEIQTTSVLRSNEEPTVPLVVVPRADSPVLPITTTVFTLPPSPLRPSDKTGTRYLVRLTFPTARYEVPTIEDPLTGEMRNAPPSPQWLKDLREGGAVVDILIKPLVVGETFKDVANRKKGSFGQDATKPDVSKTGPIRVLVEGTLVEVVGEKRAVVMLGKALDDERISKMPWLARSDAVLFPRALADPVGVATPFLNDPPPKEESPPERSSSSETTNIVADASDKVPINSKDTPVSEQANQTTKLMSLFSAYSSSVTWITGNLGKKTNPLTAGDSTSNVPPTHVPDSSANEGESKDDGMSVLPQLTSNALCAVQRVTVPLSSAIVIALISFLIGSLLRSLLSPADFVYVARDAQDMHEFGDEHGGWRELRRLMELRYIFGGWDFVVAVVRRH